MTQDRTRGQADTAGKAAATREAKGSVQEAIGKLIGDDAVRDQGSARKRSAAKARTGA